MNTTWNFILAGAVVLASVTGIVSGEAAQGELRLVEAATSISGGAGLRPGVTPGTTLATSAP